MTNEYDVVIVGGGAAGIGAARALAQTPLSVLLVEAGARLGGRAHTHHAGGLALDLGCGWLHSAERNPWREIAETTGFTVDRTPSAWRSETPGHGMTHADHAAADTAWQAWETALTQAPPASDCAADALEPGNPWNAYLDALSGYINGANLAALSVQDYLTYDNAATDTNWRVAEGYGTLVAASLPRVPISVCNPVTAIDHSGAHLVLTTHAGTIRARAVIVTVSTAMLAGGAIRFGAAVDAHLHAAACLPLGLANKLFLRADPAGPFARETHMIGNPRSAETGSYYVMPLGAPVIECYYGGHGAARIEQGGPQAAFAFAQDELAGLYGHDARRHVQALAASAWHSADWINGSYSHALPGQAHQRAVLAQPVDARLFFAGEATHPTDFSTAHGALQSGLRAAQEAVAALA